MKTISFMLLILALSTFSLKAQQGEGRRYYPPNETMLKNQMTLQDYIDFMDDYWDNTPHDSKGSGIKPYLRWRENIKYITKANGELMTNEEIKASWQNILQNRNSLTDNSDWIPIGPFDHINAGSWSVGSGRVNITTVDPNNPDILYIGTPDGGAWKSINHGQSWTSITDNLPVWGVSGIAVDPNNSDIVYISTGDEDGWDSYSIGVYKSTNGGNTWQATSGISNYAQLGEIYINPNDTNMLWVCSTYGLYRTTNAGNTWSITHSGYIKEIRVKPGNPNILYAVERTYDTNDIKILKSTNAGQSFSVIKTYNDAGRTVIDVTNANPEALYVLVSNSDNSFKTLDRSLDSGNTFSVQQNVTDIYDGGYQAYYDLALVVSDTNANHVYTGCLNVWESTDGGLNFYPYNYWYAPEDTRYTHADIHDLKFYNGNLYASTDGGIYASTDNGASMQDLTGGMNIGQFYRIDVAQNNLSQIVGGLQDNGGYALLNDIWKVYHGADGMDCAINPTNPNQYLGFIQYGQNLYTYNPNDYNSGYYLASSPNDMYGNWITPLEIGNQGTLYAGYNSLYKLSPSNQWVIATNHTFANNLRDIRVAPDNDNLVLVYDDEGLYQSDGTENMNFSLLTNDDVHCFDYNRNNSNIIYYANNDGVFKSTDSGQNWTDISQGLPDLAYIYKAGIIHQASSVNNTLYLATRNAVYYTNDDLNEWQLYSNGLPYSQIRDIEVNNIENSVLIGTYGRGIWRSPVDAESLSVQDETNSVDKIAFYPNPAIDNIKLNVSIEEKGKIEFFNMDGKLIKTISKGTFNQNDTYNITDLPKGVYVIRLTTASHLITKKIIKK